MKRAETRQWFSQKLVEKRIDLLHTALTGLNDLYCYFTWVGAWKKFRPPDMLDRKRRLDRLFRAYAPFFSPVATSAYDTFISVLFLTFVAPWSERPVAYRAHVAAREPEGGIPRGLGARLGHHVRTRRRTDATGGHSGALRAVDGRTRCRGGCADIVRSHGSVNVQWCCKGLAKISESQIREILTRPTGLICQDRLAHWRRNESFPVGNAMRRLTEQNLDRHVNDFSGPDPESKKPFCDVTPFISLSAGCVDRDVITKTDIAHRALRTALEFATKDYGDPRRPPCPGWVIYCYVVVGSNPAAWWRLGIRLSRLDREDGRARRGLAGTITRLAYAHARQLRLAIADNYHWSRGHTRVDPVDLDVAGVTAISTRIMNDRGLHPWDLAEDFTTLPPLARVSVQMGVHLGEDPGRVVGPNTP